MGPKICLLETNYSEETRERLQRLMNEGKQVEATSERIDINKQPDYFDGARFKKAQVTCNKYYSNLSMASTTGLMLLVQIESILVPLLKTGKSRTVPDLHDRYVATAKYIRKCYETDFYNSTSEGWKYIMLVRNMHKRIHQIMNANNKEIVVATNGMKKLQSNHEHLWVNQYDMALTQFAFVGLLILEPKKCGAYNISGQELSDITYYWRLMSYYFGIEERFNIFVYHDDINKQTELMQAILNHQKELLQSPRIEVGVQMAKGIMLAFEDLTTDQSFNILDHWWAPSISVSGQTELSPYTLSDRWKLISFYFLICLLLRVETLRDSVNRLYKRKFDKFCEASEKIKTKLGKKYGHLVYE